MAGYEDTRQKIISTLMGRPVGTEIQPENHQDYALNMLDYIRSLELIATSTLIGIADENTTPVQPNNSRVCYIAGVSQNQTVTFQNFIDENGTPISVTTGDMEGIFIILLWNTQYWSAQTFSTNIISQSESATFYYRYNIRKTYESIALMNADVASPIGTDGKYIKIGDIVTVVNSTTPSENGVYSYEGATDGWKYQSSFNFQVENVRSQNVNTSPSSKLFDDELAQLRSDLNQKTGKYEYKKDVTGNVSSSFLGNCDIKKDSHFFLQITGTANMSRLVLAADYSLLYRLKDYTPLDNNKYELIATQDITELYWFVDGVSAQGSISINITSSMAYNDIKQDEQISQIGIELDAIGEILATTNETVAKNAELISYNYDNIFNKNKIEEGFFYSATGDKYINAGWGYENITVESGATYSFSGGRRMTCYKDINGNVISGGSDSVLDALYVMPQNVVSVIVSVPITNKDNLVVCKSNIIVKKTDIKANPVSPLNIYNKQETEALINGETIEVGVGKQYTKVIDAFTYAASKTTPIKILIYNGIYDIYNEIGGESYISSLSSSVVWYNTLPVFLGDVKIVGIGDVVLKLQVPDNIYTNYKYQSTRLSIVNNRGSISIDNITLVVKNVRYAIHDECDSFVYYEGTNHVYKNCRIEADNCLAGVGIGLSSSMYLFENCYTNNNGARAVYLHSWPTNNGSHIIINNSALIGSTYGATLRVYSLKRVCVDIMSSYLTTLNVGTEDSVTYNTNIFDIICKNTNINTVGLSSGITINPYTPKFYNW